MTIPGTPASMRPAGEDWIARDLAAIRSEMRESVASVAASFRTTVAQLTQPQAFEATTDDFATGNLYTTIAETTLTVPAGFTSAVVMATAWARLFNTSASVGAFSVRASIDGADGPTGQATDIAPSTMGTAQGTYARVVTGLTEGATFTVRARAFASPEFTADVNSEASVNGIAIWFR